MTASRDEIMMEKQGSKWRRRTFGQTYERAPGLAAGRGRPTSLENAEKITWVPREKIIKAAEMLARPRGKLRPKATFMLEKGNYWSFNFPASASLSSLGLLCGAGSRPGHNMCRAGGHQRGGMKLKRAIPWASPGSNPSTAAPDLAGADAGELR